MNARERAREKKKREEMTTHLRIIHVWLEFSLENEMLLNRRQVESAVEWITEIVNWIDSKEEGGENRMFCTPAKKQKKKEPAAWRVFNFGTNLEFAECSGCEHIIEDYDPYDMPMRCPKCGSEMNDVEFVD